MASFNKVILLGNLTRDPELRYTPSGIPVCNFDLAVNRSYTTAGGEKKDDVTFIGIVVWAKPAEACGQYLSKGRPVLVEGHLQQRSWEAQDGSKRSKHEVVAERVQFLGADKNGTGAPAEEPAPAAAPTGAGDDVPF